MEPEKSSVEDLLETGEGSCEFAQEELALEATELIAELMERSQVTKSELAKRSGKSRAYITQVLSGSRNMTVHTLAGLAFALGYKVNLAACASGDIRVLELGERTLREAAHCVPPAWKNARPERGEPAPPAGRAHPIGWTSFLHSGLYLRAA